MHLPTRAVYQGTLFLEDRDADRYGRKERHLKGIAEKVPDAVFTPISPVGSVNLVVGSVNFVAFSLWDLLH